MKRSPVAETLRVAPSRSPPWRVQRRSPVVTLARGAGELEQALSTSRFDVMIAYANDMVAATTQIANASREPTLIPVLHELASEREMRERYPRLVTGNFKDFAQGDRAGNGSGKGLT